MRKNTLRALVADHNESERRLLGSILKTQGLAVDFALNGEDAVVAASVVAFDLILMDMDMPRMGALAATRLIREHEEATDRAPAPLYVVTAQGGARARARARAAGADGHIAKPVPVVRILEAVRHCRLYAQVQALVAQESKGMVEATAQEASPIVRPHRSVWSRRRRASARLDTLVSGALPAGR